MLAAAGPSLPPPPPTPPSVHRIVPQVFAAMLQRRPFDAALFPSPLFGGWSTALVRAVLASIPRFFLLSPRSLGRQPPSPSLRHRSPLNPRPLPAPTALLCAANALEFYSWVASRCGFPHDELTCRETARVLVRAKALPAIWRFLRANEALVTTATATAVIQALGEEGLAKEALAAFYRMKQLHCKPDVQCYNTLLAALCRVGQFKKARFLLDQMELPGASCPPDAYTYTIFIGFYCKRSLQTGCRKAIRRRIWEANHMFRRMVFNGFAPDIVTYNCLINGLCKTYRIGRAQELFDDMLLKGCSPNRVTYNSFIRYYSVVNEVDKAVQMMRDMVLRGHGKPTSSSYTPIIHSLCESRRVLEARDYLVEMVNGGNVPREFTYKLVCDALHSAGEEGLPEELCRSIEDGIHKRLEHVMQLKTMMGLRRQHKSIGNDSYKERSSH